ncbi:conserved Plasmodium protein, unknown function [Plasmodium knowlesi strain H]|uniref:Uncharacterized protein n=3 Tax=Plasmodium knowlesi TaxID=5850 RepID=A0A5K1UG75_PLAKH|nr:conserved Plasmodium protein, unknown function [Plasmodium knowlesi strain H]OTN65952.1 Uncharacterized protein PKNOH_S100063100 [Plasmodium knowlesi]CAA9987983.1 conserved Plasmodium protein, unknown function [Plasmodium knowlesi strain H]SBO22099.1 conserved Plasmodium protein, unknown function [Plasmodium knowlesi strain H]SBO29160.1 conserved Plasmodium protein, unknown function [Plasmodium knowlesi strain H]VVS77457.1 conserved Plasmodium protein, unknown function [Plasmodium knowlesi |eukprot:XP_002258962.1 hypothetical protein, conserved in Plasmodium species [Plasmodium knowlesi strain H]
MASRLTSLLCSVGKFPCKPDCLSGGKCEDGDINLCDIVSIEMNKRKTLDDCFTTSSSDDRYKYQDSSDISKYNFHGCIKKEGFPYTLQLGNFNASNLCPAFLRDKADCHRNGDEQVSSSVIDLDDEVLIANIPLGCFREVAQRSLNTLEYGNSRVNITERNMRINRKDTDLMGHNVRTGEKQPSHLYSEIGKPDAAGSEHSMSEGEEEQERQRDQNVEQEEACDGEQNDPGGGDIGHVIFPPNFDATNEAPDKIGEIDEMNRVKKSSSYEKKKKSNNNTMKKKESKENRGRNLRSMFGFFARAEPAISNSSRSCREKVSDASSEFLSVISSAKSNA